MASQRSFQQQRVISSFIRRNRQGWGRPLAFTIRRLQLGGALLALSLVLGTIIGVVVGPGNLLRPQSPPVVTLWVPMVIALFWGANFWVTSLPAYLAARRHADEIHTGVVSATVCDLHETLPFVHDHFITLREADGQLRAFTIPPKYHEHVCLVGQKVTLVVTPGIDHLVEVR